MNVHLNPCTFSIPCQFQTRLSKYPLEKCGLYRPRLNKGILQEIANVVYKIAGFILLYGYYTTMFLLSSTVFAVGFLTGIIADEKLIHIIGKMQLVWKKQSPGIKCMLLLGAFLSIPVPPYAACFLTGGSIGANMMQDAIKNQTQHSDDDEL